MCVVHIRFYPSQTYEIVSRLRLGAFCLPAFLLCIFLALGQAVEALPSKGYYDGAGGKEGMELRLALHEIIKGQQAISYDSLWKAYETTDAGPDGKPFCIYSEHPFKDFNPIQGGPAGKVGSYLTREHSWPKGWWGGEVNPAYSDLFHVILGDAHVNGQKGIKPLGETGPDGKEVGISKTGPARPGSGYAGHVFEPADRHKGDFARNYLYFSVRYLTGEGALDCSRSPMIFPDGHEFRPWAVDVLLKWNRQDPVSDRERERNEKVYRIQKNRNPFIDHPEYADRIWAAKSEGKPWIGVDANYSLEMEQQGKEWKADGKKTDLFGLLRKSGCDSFRLRVWTGDYGANGLRYAGRLAERAQDSGLKPYVVLFLSDDWADYVKQPVPEAWKGMEFPEKLKAVEAYAEKVARFFEDRGTGVDLFEIGNEIDYGICGEFEEDWAKRASLPYMKERIWPRMAQIIAAAQKGIRKVRPRAQFALHLAQWNQADYCIAFWKNMAEQGVTVDYPGLSYFPSSAKTGENSMDDLMKQVRKIHEALGKQVLICEYAYPSQAQFGGQFAEWNHPVKGYELDGAGQEKWLKDFMRLLRKQDLIAGAWYWSPEWHSSDMWRAFSLFQEDGSAKPALKSFAKPEAGLP